MKILISLPLLLLRFMVDAFPYRSYMKTLQILLDCFYSATSEQIQRQPHAIIMIKGNEIPFCLPNLPLMCFRFNECQVSSTPLS